MMRVKRKTEKNGDTHILDILGKENINLDTHIFQPLPFFMGVLIVLSSEFRY
jgi:hypothetical protein